jgi:pyruvate dehydrogenase E2 component (dihydrolipoamide acetyltransferase)
MPIEVRLPELGDSVTHAKLAKWLKGEGDQILEGEPIAEVETDKTNLEIEAPHAGVLIKIQIGEGTDQVPIDAVLALIAVASELEAAPPAAVTIPIETPDAKPHAGGGPTRTAPLRDLPRRDGALAVALSGHPDLTDAEKTDAGLPATPLARRMAHAAGIGLAGIKGTGPAGRITKSDIEAVLQPVTPVTPLTTAAPETLRDAIDSVDLDYELRPLSAMRRITGERLARAKQTIPHFYLQTDCDVEQVSRMRNELNARSDAKISLTAFFVRAAALALKTIPSANSTWDDGAVRVYAAADIAVAINTPSGLIAPPIRQAEQNSVLVIAGEMQALADRARAGKLRPEEYSGGTFTLSNLGMFGIGSIYPIINPPQSCILGVGAVEQRPVVRDGAIVARLVMTCTLSADHRVVDGATGAEFLGAFRRLIEDPWRLML